MAYFRLHPQLLRRRVSAGEMEDDTMETLIAMLGERFPSVVGERVQKKPSVFFFWFVFYGSGRERTFWRKSVFRSFRCTGPQRCKGERFKPPSLARRVPFVYLSCGGSGSAAPGERSIRVAFGLGSMLVSAVGRSVTQLGPLRNCTHVLGGNLLGTCVRERKKMQQ